MRKKIIIKKNNNKNKLFLSFIFSGFLALNLNSFLLAGAKDNYPKNQEQILVEFSDVHYLAQGIAELHRSLDFLKKSNQELSENIERSQEQIYQLLSHIKQIHIPDEIKDKILTWVKSDDVFGSTKDIDGFCVQAHMTKQEFSTLMSFFSLTSKLKSQIKADKEKILCNQEMIDKLSEELDLLNDVFGDGLSID